MNFEHEGIKYLVKKESVCIFYQYLPGRENPAKLFTVKYDNDDITVDILITEIENRKAQRQSAINGTFRLNPSI